MASPRGLSTHPGLCVMEMAQAHHRKEVWHWWRRAVTQVFTSSLPGPRHEVWPGV